MLPTPPPRSAQDTARSPLVTSVTASPCDPGVPRVVDRRSGRNDRVPMREEHGQHHIATDRRTPHSLASAFRIPGGRSCSAASVGDPFHDRRRHLDCAARRPLRAGPASAGHRRQHREHLRRPGFLAGRVDFESSLRGALRNGDAPTVNGGHDRAFAGADQHQRQQRQPRPGDGHRHRDRPAVPAGPERAGRQVQRPAQRHSGRSEHGCLRHARASPAPASWSTASGWTPSPTTWPTSTRSTPTRTSPSASG